MTHALKLATLIQGEPHPDLPPLVIAHGLFGSARNWGVIAKRLSETRQVIAVDMRNHGDSPHHPVQTYAAMAADLAAVIEDQGGRAAVLGHSMGGKAAMVLALSAPELVERLIVADIAPVAYEHDQRLYVRAMQGVDLSRITRRSDAEAGLADAVPEPSLRAFFLQSLKLDEDGARWKLNLAALDDQMPGIVGFPAVEGIYPGPALFLSGELSSYVRPEHWPVILEHFPAAERQVIPGAGHWLHAEAPRPFVGAVSRFLDAR